ncbi:hypothetical protein Xvie_03338 [Xenorhabdus vietnamensis]|uniref:Uncharacterized protein n=1 Tax=Xenorhabdus vietnamensis TaxID=351656 RepID=A0A1Y2SB64_9GAMM|nr:hypothetical protein Xvie_03338 [Xenorhabdus vietnamensis]
MEQVIGRPGKASFSVKYRVFLREAYSEQNSIS